MFSFLKNFVTISAIETFEIENSIFVLNDLFEKIGHHLLTFKQFSKIGKER